MPVTSRCLAVGLTGGVASGKTEVARLFEDLGVPVLDADVVARQVVTPPSPVLDEIIRTFGNDYRLADGGLDRRRMRETIFGDTAARARLEAITHPAIRAELARWRDAQTARYCILAVAILFEAGMYTLVDRVLVVDAPESEQIRRLMTRDAVDESLARRMLAAQSSRADRRSRADDVIDNQGTRETLARQVAQLHQKYLRLPPPVS